MSDTLKLINEGKMDIYDEMEAELAHLNALIRPYDRKIRNQTTEMDELELVDARKIYRQYSRQARSIRDQMHQIDPERYEASTHYHPRKNQSKRFSRQKFDDLDEKEYVFSQWNPDDDFAGETEYEESSNTYLTEEMKSDLQSYFDICNPKSKAMYEAVMNRGLSPKRVSEILGLSKTAVQTGVSLINKEMRVWLNERKLVRDYLSEKNKLWEEYFKHSVCYTERQKQVGIALCTKEYKCAADIKKDFGYYFARGSSAIITSIRRRLKIVDAARYVKCSCLAWSYNLEIWGDLDSSIRSEIDGNELRCLLGLMINSVRCKTNQPWNSLTEEEKPLAKMSWTATKEFISLFHGKSKPMIASKIGSNVSTVRRMCSGKTVSYNTARKLSDYFGWELKNAFNPSVRR